MRQIIRRTILILSFAVGVLPVVAFADNDKIWTGEGLLCASGNDNWSNGDNWQGGTAPTSGGVQIGAATFCGETCEPCACFASECSGGPRNGLSCSTTDDCDC